jgi:type III secretion YscU/HrpY family protein
VSGEKTEQPTEKKLRDARREGRVAKSRDAVSAAVVLTTAGALAFTGESALAALREAFALALGAIEGTRPAVPGVMLEATLSLGLRAVAPVLAAATMAGALVGFLQVGPLLALDAVEPRFSRLDPIAGVGNLFQRRRLVELAKAMIVVVIVGATAWATLRGELRGVLALTGRSAEQALRGAGELVVALLLRVGGAMAALAVLDVLYQRWQFLADQRMTKDEVKREHKESDGDPHTKGERERLRRELLEHGLLERVRSADVLVVNPTHLAVALHYDEGGDDALPEVVARGSDELAQRMIRAAEEAGVPVLRDVPLARALHALEDGESIPESLFEAVAAVLHVAWEERARDDDDQEPSR